MFYVRAHSHARPLLDTIARQFLRRAHGCSRFGIVGSAL